MAETPEGWETRGKPPMLFRRFEFARYGEIRDFLDALAAVSEEAGMHPQNINFGKTYVNVTLEAADGTVLGEAEFQLAARINSLPKAESA
ncbi:MAG: 4a-hydroxytetrahydrobiopterin dehydratase [Thiobacillus sp.]